MLSQGNPWKGTKRENAQHQVIANKSTEEDPTAKARLVAREFNNGQEHPGLMAMRTVISRAMTTCVNGARRAIMLADVKTAFLYSDARRSLYVELPPGDPKAASGRYVGKLERAMYGTRDAPMIWQDPSSSLLRRRGSSRGGAGDLGIMHEYEFEDAERADVPSNIHTVHAEPLNSVHIKEVTEYLGRVDYASCMEEMNKFILKNGKSALILYGDRTHTYPRSSERCRLNWWTNRRRLLEMAKSVMKPVCHEERVEQTLSAQTVKNLIWLRFYVPPDLELLLGRDNAVCRRMHRMLKIGRR